LLTSEHFTAARFGGGESYHCYKSAFSLFLQTPYHYKHNPFKRELFLIFFLRDMQNYEKLVKIVKAFLER
jgi:hypothetical protein